MILVDRRLEYLPDLHAAHVILGIKIPLENITIIRKKIYSYSFIVDHRYSMKFNIFKNKLIIRTQPQFVLSYLYVYWFLSVFNIVNTNEETIKFTYTIKGQKYEDTINNPIIINLAFLELIDIDKDEIKNLKEINHDTT